ncbi:thioredoxin-like protein [Microdochium bolleyi]|uniref:protein disulfide-isomerase n=1 Tax=Microdochium bolleyi TaxID=196109 RepID=A0A136J761_9PEZI|nr:thioredoxin-like protein [Microdochium bolleyi]
MVLLKSFVLSGLVAVAAAGSAVLDLIPDNFDKVVFESGKPTLVEFFAPWCGHCKTLAPVYEELAQSFANSKNVQIAKVDADAERSLGRKYGVQGFPTLKWFDGKSKEPQEYKGGRDLESLTKFVTENSGVKVKRKLELPSEVNFLTDKTFSETVGGDKDVIVAFTAPWCGHCKTLAPTWETLARDFVNEPDVVIAKVDAEADNSKATAQAQGVTSYPTIKFFPKGSKEGELYSGGRSEKDLIEFINSKAGTHRVEGGGLDATAGTIEALGNIAKQFAVDGSKLTEFAEEAKRVAGELSEQSAYKYAQYYIRVFDKLSQNEGYVAKEAKRLDGLIKKGGLAPSKLDELQSKSNILSQYLQAVVEKVTGKDEL